MGRFKVTLEYEGTRYSGWQVQQNARTVQGEIIGVLRSVLKTDDFDFQGSGRTDAGVHALMQVAHLDVKTMLGPEIIRMKVNDKLPADIHLIEIEKTHQRFHARHDAMARSYLYQISRRRTAFGKRFVWWIKDDLDAKKMQAAASMFVGMKDFRSFTADDPEEKSTKVLIDSMELKEAGSLILLRVVGSHFIWKMVRQLVGVIAEVGRGKMSLNEMQELLRKESDKPARLTAPPSGLFLEGVYYGKGEKPGALVPVIAI